MNSTSQNLAETSSHSPTRGTVASLLKLQDAESSPSTFRLPIPPDRGKVATPQYSGAVKEKGRTRTIRHQLVEADPWFVKSLRNRWESYRGRLKECRQEPSAESVHQLRVATRRLSSQLIVLEGVSSRRRFVKARRMLKRQLQSLGSLRDHHVQRVFIEQHTAKFPELLLLQRAIEHREREILEAACRKVRRFKTKKLEKWICDPVANLTRSSAKTYTQDELTSLALGCAGKAFAETVERRKLIDISDLRTIHRTRVAFKKFRYIVEILPTEISGLGKRQLRSLAHYQRRMGNIQDLGVIQQGITDFIKQHEGVEALLHPFFAYLRRRRARVLLAFRKSADKLFQFWPPSELSPALKSRSHQCAA
jgi:CHAD domain-containing protein